MPLSLVYMYTEKEWKSKIYEIILSNNHTSQKLYKCIDAVFFPIILVETSTLKVTILGAVALD